MKDTKIHLGLSRHLHDDIQREAQKNNVSMSTYIRAVLARHIYSDQAPKILGEDWLVKGKDGDIFLDV